MRECYECRENDKNFKTSIHYKCSNSNCENFIAPLEISAFGMVRVRKGVMPPTRNGFRLKQQSIKSYLIKLSNSDLRSGLGVVG